MPLRCIPFVYFYVYLFVYVHRHVRADVYVDQRKTCGKSVLFIYFMCVDICVHTCHVPTICVCSTHGRQMMALDPMQLELLISVCCYVQSRLSPPEEHPVLLTAASSF